MGNLIPRKRKRLVLRGKLLREIRKEMGLTSVEVSSRMGTSPGDITDLEREERDCMLSTFRAMVEALECDHFQVLELMGYNPISLTLIKSFRAACKRHNTTPELALRNFMEVFITLEPQ